MSMHAGFMKRFMACLVDLTLIITITWLLYLFPFQQIIGKRIDEDYKTNIKEPYDTISEKYSGTTSFLGTSTNGLFGDLQDLYSAEAMSETEFASYRANTATAFAYLINSSENGVLDTFMADLNTAYDAGVSYEDQFYSKLYQIYSYIDNAYAVRSNFKEDESYITYASMVEAGLITEDEQSALEDAYDEALLASYLSQMEIIVSALKNYAALNADMDIESTPVYKNATSRITSNSTVKIEDISSTVNSEDLQSLIDFVNDYYAYEVAVTAEAKLGTATDSENNISVNVNQEAYYVFYYDLVNLQFKEQMPYYVQVYTHMIYAIIYALSMFTLLLSIYTVSMRGYTLGRRLIKIKIVGLHEKDKVNPVLVLLHDVPFRVLYIILLSLVSLPVAGIVLLVFTIVDAVMVRFTKDHKTIRDYLSGTKVISAEAY
ncbi:MAG: RDD family protein [Bacillales bacterium]|nr:RDD family protein [Bacillales bacterium]